MENIRFEPRQQPLEAEELHQILPLKMGQPLRIAEVRASIERLYATGRYADIQVDAEPYNGGVAIAFITKSSWFVGDVAVSGEVPTPPNAGQLENATRLDLGSPFTETRLKDAMAGQERLLESNGLYGTTIRPSLDYDTHREFDQVNVRFNVDGGKRARFGQPELIGDLKLDVDKILDATGFRRWLIGGWRPVTQTRMRQGLDGIRQLYQKENRLEAKVSLESVRYDPATNTAHPVISIYAGPRIEVNTIGYEISRKRLRRLVPVFEEHAVDRDLLVEGARNLQDYFQSEGFFDAQVAFKQQRVTNDRASIDFLINTGERHKLAHVEISGNRYFGTEALRERMFLQPATLLQFRRGRYSGALLRTDEEAIANLYRSNGFREVRVTHRIENTYRGKRGDIAVFIAVEEGPQSLIESLDLAGLESLEAEAIQAALSSVPGQPFSEFNVALDRDAILGRYFARGFPNATFEWTSQEGSQPTRVRLRYMVRQGEEQVVRQVVATGLKTTRESLVNRNLTLNPGDPLSPTAITDTQRRLYELGVFAKVDAAIQNPEGETARKYVLYNVAEAGRFSVALGFGADLGRIGGCRNCLTAPAGATGFSPRISLDITRNNVWGLAHTLSLRTRVSTLQRRGVLNYSWPRFRLNDALNVSFTGYFEDSHDVRTANFRRIEGSAQLSQRLTKATTAFYRFAYRRVSVRDLIVTPFLLNQLSQPVRLGLPSLNLIQDRRDDPIEPHRGIYNTVDIGLAERIFGSQRNFLRVLVRNATYHPVGKRSVLARSTQLGNIHGFHYDGTALESVPLPERFFAGGGTSHRGFPDFGAGPRDPSTGFPLGGTALFLNQTEFRFPLIGENFGAVLFHDAGNSYSSLGDFSFRVKQRSMQDFDYMVHAVGLGLRYRTPIGPFRVDLGYSINPPKFFGFDGDLDQLREAGPNPCSPPPGLPNRCGVQSVNHFQFSFSIGQTF